MFNVLLILGNIYDCGMLFVTRFSFMTKEAFNVGGLLMISNLINVGFASLKLNVYFKARRTQKVFICNLKMCP